MPVPLIDKETVGLYFNVLLLLLNVEYNYMIGNYLANETLYFENSGVALFVII